MKSLNKTPEGVKILRIVRCRRLRLCGNIPPEVAADTKKQFELEPYMQWYNRRKTQSPVDKDQDPAFPESGIRG